MRLAFHTNALGSWPIANLADFARQNGFAGLEVGPTMELDYEEMKRAREQAGVEYVCFTYCRNVLDVDPDVAAWHRRQVLERLKMAGRLGVPLMVTATGRAQNLPMEESLEPGMEFLGREVLPLARELGVKVAIENCPAIGNVAVSPFMWRKLFGTLPELGLAYDPSHLVWQFMDPYRPLIDFAERILHVHAKDTEILEHRLDDTGIEGQGWWRYRIPGWGQLNWTRIVSGLLEAGYKGAVSLEHEDPVWEGSDEKVTHALRLGHRLLTGIWRAD